MVGGGRRILGHVTPRELFPSTSHANTETSQEVTPESRVDGTGTSTQVPETQDDDFTMGEVATPAARRTLHPTGLWFDDNTVSTSITEIFQAHWRKPWLNYDEADEGTKTHWWNQFTKLYLWNADLDTLVKKEYEKKAHKRLKEMAYNASVRNKSVPKWMGQTTFQQMMEKRNKKDFQERSEKAKKNRRGGSLSNPIEPSHFQGSISASKHAKKMAQKAGGVLPSAPEVFLKTHFKEVPGKGTIAANKRAQEISDAYQKKLDESSTQGSQPDPNQLYWEVVGGRKKGVVKGLGASASLFYSPSSEKRSQSYNPSIASQLEERVQAEVVERIEEAKVQMQSQMEAQFATQLQEALKKEREEAAIESKRMMETMLQNLFSNCSGGPSFQFRREDDPDMSGGGVGQQAPVS